MSAVGWAVSLSPWVSWSATTSTEHYDHQPKHLWHKLDLSWGLRPPQCLSQSCLAPCWDGTRGDTSPSLLQ